VAADQHYDDQQRDCDADHDGDLYPTRRGDWLIARPGVWAEVVVYRVIRHGEASNSLMMVSLDGPTFAIQSVYGQDYMY
jgi:hypothetical protein